MKKYIIVCLLIILIFPLYSAANWPAQWADSQFFWKDSTGDIYEIGSKIGINRANPRYWHDVSGDGAYSGKLYANGGIDASGDLAGDTLTITWAGTIGDTLDVTGITTLTNLDVSDDIDASGDVRIVGTLDVTGDTNLTTLHTTGDITSDANIEAASYTISGSLLDMDDLSDGSTNAAITLVQEASYDATVTSFDSLDMDDLSDGSVNAAITLVQEVSYDLAYDHISNDGSDHSFIDQSVVSGANPTFGDVTVDNISVVSGGYTGAGSSTAWTYDSTNGDVTTQSNLGIGTADPNSIAHISSTAPIQIIENTTEENTSGGRRSVINMVGFRADGTDDVLGQIATSHNGAGVDGRGRITISVSDSSGTLLHAFDVSSDGLVTFNYDTYMGGIAFEDDSGEINLYDFGVSSDSTTDTVHSVTLPIDGEAILTVGGDSSGDGTVKNLRVEIETEVGLLYTGTGHAQNQVQKYRNLSAAYTIPADASNCIYYCDGTFTITLSAIDSDCSEDNVTPIWRVMNIGSGTITMDSTTDAQTYINDATSDTLIQYEGLTIGHNGSRYWTIP